MGDIMEDRQINETYYTQADRQGGTEDSPMIHHFDNPLETLADFQQSEARLVSSTIEGESEIQEADDGAKSPMQYSSSMGGDAQDDDEALDNHLPPAQYYNDVHHEQRGTSVDYEGDTEMGSGGETEVDDDDEGSVSERDPETEEHNCIDCTHFRVHKHAGTRQIIEQHLAIPGQQSFPSLDDLLSSHNTPGRGLYKIEEVLRVTNRKAAGLKEKIQCLQAQLDAVSEIRDEAKVIVGQARTTFSEAHGAAGISDRLWAKYEAFCESLEPESGSRGGWSVTCFHNHNGSYIQWDPNLDLFKDTAEISLKICNFRSEATTINHSNGNTEYVVEFWPLASLKPRTETARTWKQQYVSSSPFILLYIKPQSQLTTVTPAAQALQTCRRCRKQCD